MGRSIYRKTLRRMAALSAIIFIFTVVNFTFSQISLPGRVFEEFTHKVRGRFLSLTNCCNNAERYCKRPCAGRPCTSQCRIQCGFLSGLCPPVTCQAANPAQCSGGSGGGGGGGGSRCPTGYTDLGRVCVEVVAGPANYLSAILDCERRGGTLATVESQQEQDALYALTGSTGAWIGLTDFLDEGEFAWTDGSPVTFSNFRAGQPNNGNSNQHCTWIRPDGFWDDITCKKQEQYICQKPPRP